MYKTMGPVVCFFFVLEFVKATQIIKKSVDVGKNLTVPCPIHNSKDVIWIREGREDQQHLRMSILDEGSLFITQVQPKDSGVYACNKENEVSYARVNITVKTPPPPLSVYIKPSTIIALIIWEVKDTGGYPIINFTAQYRLANTNDTWIAISPNHIMPNSRQIEVFNLLPNTTYEFRIWASNQLGKGEIVTVLGTTKSSYNEEEIARHMLDGAEKFDTRMWAVAVGVVMGTLILLAIGTCVLLYQECQVPGTKYTGEEEQEVIELVPNIILNPGYENNQNDQVPDENSNSETPLRLNNNTVIQPQNV